MLVHVWSFLVFLPDFLIELWVLEWRPEVRWLAELLKDILRGSMGSRDEVAKLKGFSAVLNLL